MDVFGIIGNPVGHSLSPPMHEAAYADLGMEARYLAFEPERRDLEPAIHGARALGIRGLNVTIPFKEDVLTYVEADDLARRIGAVNTIDFGTSPPTGYNTDASGARRAIERHDVPLEGTEAVLVGAGGAGRGIAFMLSDAGATVHIANRTTERAHALADEVPNATGYDL
ncbi:MAG: shikimate dehydrogenase, partial [Halobacteriales archaeon]|nr:shikimate dehydrogenase [Halobacteriales archaeon]